MKRGVQFPSQIKQKVESNTKRVEFSLSDDKLDDAKTINSLTMSVSPSDMSKDSSTLKLNSQKRKYIDELHQKMMLVKEAAKKCKKFIKKSEKKQFTNKNNLKKMRELMIDSAIMANKCETCLRSKHLGPHIQNYKQLIQSMKKYELRFNKAVELIDS